MIFYMDNMKKKKKVIKLVTLSKVNKNNVYLGLMTCSVLLWYYEKRVTCEIDTPSKFFFSYLKIKWLALWPTCSKTMRKKK